MRENTNHNNSEYGHFLDSVILCILSMSIKEEGPNELYTMLMTFRISNSPTVRISGFAWDSTSEIFL